MFLLIAATVQGQGRSARRRLDLPERAWASKAEPSASSDRCADAGSWAYAAIACCADDDNNCIVGNDVVSGGCSNGNPWKVRRAWNHGTSRALEGGLTFIPEQVNLEMAHDACQDVGRRLCTKAEMYVGRCYGRCTPSSQPVPLHSALRPRMPHAPVVAGGATSTSISRGPAQAAKCLPRRLRPRRRPCRPARPRHPQRRLLSRPRRSSHCPLLSSPLLVMHQHARPPIRTPRSAAAPTAVPGGVAPKASPSATVQAPQ